MIKIIYPNKKPSIKTENGKEYIFCIVRKRWYIITPEEWVRQNFLLYLHHTLGFSLQIIAVEKQIILSELKKRFDIVVYQEDKPFMIVECKELNVKLSDDTIAQVLRYNAVLQAPYIVITNGSYCKGFLKDADSFLEIFELPSAS
jgi:hypothetical protein